MKSFKFWQNTTALSLFLGYTAYYICRSNLSIATPLIVQEFADEGINKEVIGQIASIGVMFYALGKVINGILGDLLGGKKIFIFGMVGSIIATICFGLGTGLVVFFYSLDSQQVHSIYGVGRSYQSNSELVFVQILRQDYGNIEP